MQIGGPWRWAMMAVAALLGAGALLLIDPSAALLFRVIGLLGGALFVVSVVVMLLTFRKARELSERALAISATISVICTMLFFLLTGSPASLAAAAAACSGGALVGTGWSMTQLLFVERETVRVQGSLWFLAVWALSLLFPQAIGFAGLRTPYAVAMLSFFGMGLAVGNAAGLIVRRRGALQASRLRARA